MLDTATDIYYNGRIRKDNTMNVEQLLEAGFQEFPVNKILNRHADRNFQKRYRDLNTKETLYFVNMEMYNFHTHTSFNADMQTKDKNGHTFNTVLLDVISVNQVELFFSNIFHNMECKPYDN